MLFVLAQVTYIAFFFTQVIKNGYERIAVFEDDVRFEAYFRTRLFNMLLEVEKALPEWDLM